MKKEFFSGKIFAGHFVKKYACSVFSIFLFLFMLTGFFSCSKNKAVRIASDKKSESSVNHKKTIGFSIDTLAIERWQRDLDVFMNKAKENGVDVIVQNAGNKLEEQNRQLMYLANRNVDVIVVLPKQADGLTESIQKIKAKGIPVISYDRLVLNADIDLYITINSERVGELMAQGLMSRTGGRNWFCILGPEEDYNMTLIKRGINKKILGSPIHIGYTYYTDGWNYDLAYEEMIRLITNGDVPDAIVCGNDALADSVIRAMSMYYSEKHIPVCGQDADIAACQYIVQGKQDFTIYKPISQLAQLCAEYAVRIVNGESVSEIIGTSNVIKNGFGEIPVVWLEPAIVTKENIDRQVIDTGFHTKDEIYR